MATYQRILMPMTNVNITQKEFDPFSHPYKNAIDLAGKNTGIENVRAPVDIKIVAMYKYNSMGNCVIVESTKKVLFADGTLNYATFQFMHDNNINDLYVGKKIKQWQVFYQEGTTGFATGNHIHLAVKKGKFEGFDASGWALKGAIKSVNAFVLVEGLHKIINLLGIKYRTVSKNTYTTPKIKNWSSKKRYKLKKGVKGLNVRTSATTKKKNIYLTLTQKSKPRLYYGEIKLNGINWYVYKRLPAQKPGYVAAKYLDN